MSNSVSVGNKTASWTGAFGGGSDGISGRKAQQWYAYDNTNDWIRGKFSGSGKSRRFGLLNVFKCNNRSRPAGGSVGKMLLPKFLPEMFG